MRWGGLPALIEREIYRFMTVITQTVIPPIISSFLFVFIFGFALGKAIQTMGGFSYLVFIVPGLMCLYLIERTIRPRIQAQQHNNNNNNSKITINSSKSNNNKK